jgi:hypothetical protein
VQKLEEVHDGKLARAACCKAAKFGWNFLHLPDQRNHAAITSSVQDQCMRSERPVSSGVTRHARSPRLMHLQGGALHHI